MSAPRSLPAWIPLLALGLLEGAALAGLGWVPGARHTPLPALALWAVAFLAYAAAGWRAGRAASSPAALWGVGLGLRAALLPLAPHYSEDIYRYMWDGWVQLHGVNPYLHAPADPALAGLRTGWHALVNHPEIPTIYPPAAQIAFLLLALAGPSLLLFKLAWLACDLAVAWMIDRWARARGEGPGPETNARAALLLYLWSPLLVVEVAWSGHLEPLGLLPMVGAVLLLSSRGGARGRGALAGGLLGLGAAVKLAPAAALPALLRRRGLAAAATGAGVLALLALPYAAAGGRLVAGLGAWAERWEFNPGLWAVLAHLLGPGRTPRIVAALAVAAVAAVAAVRRWPVERALFWTIGTALLLSPTLHPWYALWILPFAAVRRSRPWLLLTGLVFLAYAGRSAYLETGVWPEPTGLALLIHLPFLALLLGETRAGRWLRGRFRDRGD